MSTGEEYHETPILQSLISWAKSNGAFIHESLIFVTGKNSGSSTARTTAPISPRTRLFTMPESLAITYSKAIINLPTDLSRCDSPVSSYAILSTFLALEKLQGTKSFWHPYIAALPSVQAGCGGPMFHSSEDLGFWLGGTNLSAREVENIKEDWRADWKAARESLGKARGWEQQASRLTWELYLWAASIFTSRAFPDKLFALDSSVSASQPTLPAPELASQMNDDGSTQLLQITDKGGSKPALFPLLDILNHKPRTKITWQAGNGAVSFIAEENLEEGVEVFNNYGPKPNQQLLLSYGFAIRDNPDDTVMLKLKPQLNPIQQAIRDQQILAKDDSGIYHLKVDASSPPTQLVQLFRILVANQRELKLLMGAPAQPLKGRNEITAKVKILNSLMMKLEGSLRISPSLDEAEPRISHFAAYCTDFRKGQIKILQSVIAKFEDEVNELCSQSDLYSFEDLTQPYRRFRKAIASCFGDIKDRGPGMDGVVFILAICNFLLKNQVDESALGHQLGRLLEDYPMDLQGDEDEEARVRDLYDDIFPAAATVAPKVFDGDRWTIQLLRWGTRVYQGEVIKLLGDQEYLVL